VCSIGFNRLISILFLLCGFVLGSSSEARTDRLEVFVSIPPQVCFVERIGKPVVNVSTLVSPGHSPHTYEPTPKQMAALGRAEIYFRTGVTFERQLVEKIGPLFPDLAVVDTRKGVPLLYFDADGHDHSDRDVDPHVWLDPKRVKIQAAAICDALVKARPAHEDLFRANLGEFLEDLSRVDATISRLLAPLEGEAMYVYHPAFGYFADSYGLRQIAIESDGKEPGPRQLAALIQQAAKDGVRVIFIQSRFAAGYAETLSREIGASVVPLDPLAEDYLENLERSAQIIRRGLMPRSPSGGIENDRDAGTEKEHE